MNWKTKISSDKREGIWNEAKEKIKMENILRWKLCSQVAQENDKQNRMGILQGNKHKKYNWKQEIPPIRFQGDKMV